MQRRIGRKVLGRKILSEVPVVLVAYDLLEEHAARISATGRSPSGARASSALLAGTPTAGRLLLSPAVPASGWAELDAAAGGRAAPRAPKG